MPTEGTTDVKGNAVEPQFMESRARANYWRARCAIKPAVRDKTRDTGRGGKSKYSSLDAVRAVVQPVNETNHLVDRLITEDPGPEHPDNFIMVGTVVCADTGVQAAGPVTIRLRHKGGIQEIGGMITYSSRYLLCLLYGIAGEDDDDGEGAQKVRHRRSTRPAPNQAPPGDAESVADSLSTAFDQKAQEADSLRKLVQGQLTDIDPTKEEWKAMAAMLEIPAVKLSQLQLGQLQRLQKALETGEIARSLTDPTAETAETADPFEGKPTDDPEKEVMS